MGVGAGYGHSAGGLGPIAMGAMFSAWAHGPFINGRRSFGVCTHGHVGGRSLQKGPKWKASVCEVADVSLLYAPSPPTLCTVLGNGRGHCTAGPPTRPPPPAPRAVSETGGAVRVTEGDMCGARPGHVCRACRVEALPLRCGAGGGDRRRVGGGAGGDALWGLHAPPLPQCHPSAWGGGGGHGDCGAVVPRWSLGGRGGGDHVAPPQGLGLVACGRAAWGRLGHHLSCPWGIDHSPALPDRTGLSFCVCFCQMCCTPARAHTRAHARTHARTHTRTHAHTHAHTRAHARTLFHSAGPIHVPIKRSETGPPICHGTGPMCWSRGISSGLTRPCPGTRTTGTGMPRLLQGGGGVTAWGPPDCVPRGPATGQRNGVPMCPFGGVVCGCGCVCTSIVTCGGGWRGIGGRGPSLSKDPESPSLFAGSENTKCGIVASTSCSSRIPNITPPPVCNSHALVQATAGVGTVLLWYLI